MDYLLSLKNALNHIPDSNAFFIYPETWPEDNQVVITFAEIDNRPGCNADNKEYTTKTSIKIDVFHRIPEMVKITADKVVEALPQLGYDRDFRTGVHKDIPSGLFRDILYYKLIL